MGEVAHVPEVVEPEAPARPAPRRPALVWAVPALVTLGLCLVGIGRPVLWQDELATVSAASRSLPELLRLVLHRDAVHTVYYLIVQGVTSLVGVTPVTVRLPSALAAAGFAALTALLAARLAGARAGLVAGLLVALAPAVSQFGTEARPYALAAFVATGSTLLLLVALERRTRRWWLAYAAGVLLLGAVQLIALALLPAHAVAVARGDRGALARWTAAVLPALALLSPLILLGLHQSGQVGWIAPPTWRSVLALPGLVPGSPIVAGLLVGVALPALTRREPGGAFGLLLAVVPVAVVLLVSLHSPTLLPRYLLFCVAGLALAAAVAVAGRGLGPVLGLLLAVLLLGLPAQVDARAGQRNGQPDYRSLGAVLDARTQPGDAMVVPDIGGIRFRVGLQVYTSPGRLPRDVLAAATAAQSGRLDSALCPADRCLGVPPRVWVGCAGDCRDPLAALAPRVRAQLLARGYRAERSWPVAGGSLALYRR